MNCSNSLIESFNNDFESFCAGNEANGFIQQLANAYPSSMSSYFCSHDCPCKADKDNFHDSAIYLTAEFSSNGATTVLNCPTNPVSSVKATILSLLGFLEEELDCSGLCKKEKWYYFSDVNRGPPPTKCKDKLLDNVNCIFETPQ